MKGNMGGRGKRPLEIELEVIDMKLECSSRCKADLNFRRCCIRSSGQNVKGTFISLHAEPMYVGEATAVTCWEVNASPQVGGTIPALENGSPP